MRHLLGNIAIYIIVIFLAGAAALFGWARSSQLVVTEEAGLFSGIAPAPEQSFEWKEAGEKGYHRNCANCHGQNGEGWDQYPGLGFMAILFQSPNGREYVVDLHLYGLASSRWGAPMPPMGHLSDIELAAILNHALTNFGNEQLLQDDAELYVPQEIGQRRGQNLAPRQVNAQRPNLADSEGE